MESHLLAKVIGLVAELEKQPDFSADTVADVFNQFRPVLGHMKQYDMTFVDLLLKNEFYFAAEVKLKELLERNPNHVLAWDRWNSLVQATIPVWHFAMLNDSSRNNAFRNRIQTVINEKAISSSGEEIVILDIGSGTGLLAFYAEEFANQSGLTNISTFACEAHPKMVQILKSGLTYNKIESIRVLPKLSTELSPQDMMNNKADVLITETFDAGLFGEHCLEIIDHAWKNLLKEDAKIVPNKAKVLANLVQCEKVRKKTFVSKKTFGYLSIDNDLNLINSWTEKEPYTSEKISSMDHVFLSDPEETLGIDFEDQEMVEKHLREETFITKEFVVTEVGWLDFVCIWFEISMGSESISNHPERKSCWEQAVYPLRKPIRVDANDHVVVVFKQKGHLELVSCHVKEKPFPHNIKKLPVNSNIVSKLNSHAFENFIESVANSMSFSHETPNILDISGHGLLSLRILKSKPNATSSFFIQNSSTSDLREMLDFIISMAQQNQINPENITCLPEDQLAEESWDLVLLDPIDKAGRINDTIVSLLPTLKKLSCQIFPTEICLKCQVVDFSGKLANLSCISDTHLATNALKLERVMKPYFIRHFQDMDLSDLTFLSNPFELFKIPVSNLGQSQNVEKNVDITANGKAFAIVYWFEYSFKGNTFSTRTDLDCDHQAIIINDPVFDVKVGNKIKCSLAIQSGALKIRLVN